MIRALLAFTLLLCTLSLCGCAASEYEASDEHCSITYLINKPANYQTYTLQKKCLTGYYSSNSEIEETQ
jgi:hypothetical protein